MDNAYKRILDLEQALRDIKKENLENNEKISKLANKSYGLDYNIRNLEDINENLNAQILCYKENPENRKKNKLDLIKAILLAYIVGTIVALIPVCIGNGSLGLILPCVGTSTLVMSFISSIVIPAEFSLINKKYPIADIGSFEKNIEKNKEKMESLFLEKQKMSSKEISLYKTKKILEDKISEIERELKHIKGLRLGVILDYCKNNLELDEKINEKYEKSFIEKVKIK